MKSLLFGAGSLLAAAAMPPGGTAPQCLWTGTQLICPPPTGGDLATQRADSPALQQHPPEWYYGPWDGAAYSYKFGTQ
jgi:hypothetical protein